MAACIGCCLCFCFLINWWVTTQWVATQWVAESSVLASLAFKVQTWIPVSCDLLLCLKSVSLQIWFHPFSSVFRIHMLKNKTIPNRRLSRRTVMMNLSVLVSIHNPIDFNNATNTTGRNAAPKQDRPSTKFHWTQALILPSFCFLFILIPQNGFSVPQH